jgi:hypothetical protein
MPAISTLFQPTQKNDLQAWRWQIRFKPHYKYLRSVILKKNFRIGLSRYLVELTKTYLNT